MNLKKLFAISLLGAGITTSASAALISVSNNTYATVDNASTTRTFNVGPGVGPINSVGFWLDFSKCDGENPSQAAAEVGCIASGTPFFNEIHFARNYGWPLPDFLYGRSRADRRWRSANERNLSARGQLQRVVGRKS
jgi:hypothetical protein